MSHDNSCDNCGTATGNEPLTLCDYCGNEGAIASAAILCDITPAQRAAPQLLAALETVASEYGPADEVPDFIRTAITKARGAA